MWGTSEIIAVTSAAYSDAAPLPPESVPISSEYALGKAKRFSREIVAGVKTSADVFQQAALEGLRQELDTMVPRVRQVMQQGLHK